MGCKVKNSFVVLNDKGLHTRPATEIVRCVQVYKAEVFCHFRGARADAKSILELLMLCADQGAEIEVEAEGVEAEKAVDALILLSKKSFNIHY